MRLLIWSIVDRVDGDAIEARTIWQAHDIDGVTIAGRGTREVGSGSLIDVRIDSVVDDYDLRATTLSVIASRSPLPASRQRARALPLASTGSYGR